MSSSRPDDTRCPKCHRGHLLMVGRPGRLLVDGERAQEIPSDFLIPTCDQCGAEQLDTHIARALRAAVDKARARQLRTVRTDQMAILDDARTRRPEVGDVIAGNYELRRVLGAGGMGVVYEAHDRLLDRRVAIKMAQPAAQDHSLRKEARALAAIRHPSMVAVYAMGVERGFEYLVMELVRGTTLHDYLHSQLRAGERLSVAEAVELLVGIGEGLAAVHAAGISHRDVKPANIMLAPGRRTVLMDFGLFTPEFERLDTVAGSPEYMAPEVYAAHVEPGAGHLVDLYALGVIAFELLTGAPPYRGPNALATLGMHVTAPIPDLAAQRTGLPADLVALVAQLLAKDPCDRPPGIEDVVGRLRAIRARAERRGSRDDIFSVLIVDDDRDFAETVRALVRLAVPDAHVTVALDAEAALATCHRRKPRMILLDLQLPRMNGLELCMTLRGAGMADDDCEIVAVTGRATPRDRAVLEKLGVRAHVSKDPSISRLLVDVVRTSRRRMQVAHNI